MSEQKSISPLLDGYRLGDPISHHDGVSCIPAIKDESDEKYIVKIISIPASQVQLDALLLAGAYKDPQSAMAYFKELSDGVIREAECLKKLAKLEGFLPFEQWQVVPMEKGMLGYQIYLTGVYKHSLDRFMRRNTMTHLAAVNLGLDMCAALAIARQAGWIYVDLKPSNIFISDDREYRIGDLGFMSMDSLKYAAMPNKYRSPYTAPELADPLETPNETIDTYAVGMILYQIFNNGVLPKVDNPTEEELPAPANADYEMAEIILKACAPDPKNRWSGPVEMGQALVAYMQRNSVNDTPIMPPLVSSEEDLVNTPNAPMRRDETLPGLEDAGDINTEKLSEEMHSMLEQADDLISHEMPQLVLTSAEPAKQPDENKENPAAPENAPSPKEEPEEAEPTLAEDEYYIPGQDPNKTLTDRRIKPLPKGLMTIVSIVLVLTLLVSGGIWFYRDYYVQTILSLEVEGGEKELTVELETDIDEALLNVICTDTYGNAMTSPVQDGEAYFGDLLPDMLYKIRVEIEGFHKLNGPTTHEYTTPAQTQLISFTAITGSEDGSAILSFTIDGPDSEEWRISYHTPGEEERLTSFSGHTTTITGLTVGRPYTFHLDPYPNRDLLGEDTITFTVSAIVYAQDLHVSAAGNGTITAAWTAPENEDVESWIVRCYNGSGYDELITTSELTATFEGIDHTQSYTIEVTAAGMTQPARTSLSANPLTITSLDVNTDQAEQLIVNWEYEGTAPEGGWLLMYTMDGNTRQEVVQCDSTTAVIEVRVPGAAYDLSVVAANGSTVFNNTHTFLCPNAPIFQNTDYSIYSHQIETMLDVKLLPTPEDPNWSYKTINQGLYTNTFTVGQRISMLLYVRFNFFVPWENTSILYVIRDSEGKVISELVAKESRVWHDMWWNDNYHFCELDVPTVPTQAGEYTLSLYFDGMAITTVNFTVTE